MWYILFAVNSDSKNLQSKDMCINMVIEQLKGLLSLFETYRENGFENAFIWNWFWNGWKKILRMKLLNHLKSHLELIIFIFFYILYIDKAIAKLQNRFEQFKIYEDIFGFLVFYLVLKI